MKKIRSKKDVIQFIQHFEQNAAYDFKGNKFYYVLNDPERGGAVTLMYYPEGHWTFHCRGEGYCDETESQLSEPELPLFIWKHRKSVNQTFENLLPTSF